MWLDVLFQETVVREQMADAEREATLRHLLRMARQADPGGGSQTTFTFCAIGPRLKRLIERRAAR